MIYRSPFCSRRKYNESVTHN